MFIIDDIIFWAFTAGTFLANVTAAAIMAGVSVLINMALAPSIRDPKKQPGVTPFGSQTTEGEGGAIQVAYGTNRVHANIVGHFTYLVPGTVCGASAVTRYILACFGEGPWSTPDDTTIRINGRPLSDLPGVDAIWRLGLVDQTAFDQWSPLRVEYHMGQACRYGQPVTQTLVRTGWDDLLVILYFPKGFVIYGTDGDTHGRTLNLRIEVGDAIADSWQTILEGEISGTQVEPAFISFWASGTYTGGAAFDVTPAMQPRVRVTRLDGDDINSRKISEFELWAIQVTKTVNQTHPGMVLLSLGLVPHEAISGGITELSVLSTGKVVVRNNGDFATSRYHSDAIRDMLTQPVIEGSGTPWSVTYYRGVAPAQIIAAGFTAQETLADTLVPSGWGTNVGMLRCDAVFSQSGSVHEAIGQVAASGRCGLRYQGRSFGLWLDSPRVPVGLLCDGTWERNSAELVPIEADQLASEASIRYREGESGDAERTILIIDHEMDTLTTVNLDLPAVRRMHEAARLGRRELARNRLVTETLTCRADIDAVVYEPGDVVLAQIDGWSLGGRLQAVAEWSVTVDRSVKDRVTGDDKIVAQARDAVTGVQSLHYRTVASVSVDGKTLTTSSEWSAVDGVSTAVPAAGDPFLFGPADLLDTDQFELIRAAMDEHGHFALECLRYAPTLDDLDALAPDVTVPLVGGDKNHQYGGVMRRDLPGAVLTRLPGRGDVRFEWGRYTFTSNSPVAGSIAWATDTDEAGDDAGYVRCGDNFYQPADGSTALPYVYWKASAPTVFSVTDDPMALLGNYIIAKNDGGTALTGFAWIPLTPFSALWNLVTGSGKPEDNADVTADHAADISGSGATPPADPQAGWTWRNTNWCGIDCVAQWRMNDNAANTFVKDASANGNHGTAQRNTSLLATTGKFLGGLAFNGSTDLITVPSSASLNFGVTDFSGWLWFKTAYTAAAQILLCKFTGAIGWEFHIEADGKLALTLGDSVGASTLTVTPLASIRDGAWHFVGFSVHRDGSTYIYVDGTMLGPLDFTARSGTVSTAVDLIIGRYGPSAAYPFNGVLDNAALYCRRLTSDDFDACYDAGTSTEEIHLGSTRAWMRYDGTYWLLSDSDSPTIPRHADEIAESDTRKWGKVATRQIFYQGSAPASGMVTDDLWIDSDDDYIYRWDGDSWEQVQDADIAQALSEAATAQSTADGKIVTFVQDSAPTAEGIGDIWFDSNDNHKPYRWDGDSWEPTPYDVATWSKIVGDGKPDDNADVTADNIAAGITGQGDLASLDTVGTQVIDQDSVTSSFLSESSNSHGVPCSPTTAPFSHGGIAVVGGAYWWVAEGGCAYITCEIDSYNALPSDAQGSLFMFREEADGPTINIANVVVSGTDPIRVQTSTAHGLSTGDYIYIDDVGGTIGLNGWIYEITVVDDDEFDLNYTNSSVYTAYTSGGTITPRELLCVRTVQFLAGKRAIFFISFLDPDIVGEEWNGHVVALRQEGDGNVGTDFESTIITVFKR
jgi:hypothetical protein